MSSAPKTNLTPEEYLAIERAAETKSEYFRGEMCALAGASVAHNSLVANLIERLGPVARLRGCRVFPSDMRIKVTALGKYTYPDVVVVCGRPELEDAHVDTLLNPAVILEVLSSSTEAYDRGAKFQHYRKLPSLRCYVLVSQERPSVEVFTRQEGGFWRYEPFEGPDAVVTIEPPGARFTLAELFEGVLDESASGGDAGPAAGGAAAG